MNDNNSDLRYAGRSGRRPAGARLIVRDLYVLLFEHPEGMTVDELHASLRDGWMFTDAYRAYQHLIKPKKAAFGTDRFKTQAQRWYIGAALQAMLKCGSARKEGWRQTARWFVGERAPTVQTTIVIQRLAKLDPAAVAAGRADNTEFVHREQVKAGLRDALADRRLGAKTRGALQQALDLLTGR